MLITTAVAGEGIRELLEALDRHRAAAATEGTPTEARRARAAAQVRAVLVERLWDRLGAGRMASSTRRVIEDVAAHELDPYAAADQLLVELGQGEASRSDGGAGSERQMAHQEVTE